MSVFERLLGLYLAACYITMPVVCFYMWRRGHTMQALGLFAFPLLFWGGWVLSRDLLVEYHRLELGIGFLPLLLLPLVAAASWLAALTAGAEPGGVHDGPLAAAARILQSGAPARFLMALSLPGLAWFVYGMLHPGSRCTAASLVRGAGIDPMPPVRALACSSSAIGAWPLVLALVLAAGGWLWRSAHAAVAVTGAVNRAEGDA